LPAPPALPALPALPAPPALPALPALPAPPVSGRYNRRPMTIRRWVIVLALAGSTCSRAPAEPRWPGGTLVDLSHDYSAETVFWPTADTFKLEKVADGMTPQGYYYAANNFATSEHGGTHLDAPVHFAKGHRSVDQIPLDQLVGEAFVVDVTSACASQPDYRVTIDDITAWERTNGELPAAAIVR